MPEDRDNINSPETGKLLSRMRRRTISLSFLGLDIYVASFIILQLVFMFYTGIAAAMSGDGDGLYAFMDSSMGLLSVVCVIIGMAAATLYYVLVDKSYGLFGFTENPDGSYARTGIIKAIFSCKKRMGAVRAAECVGIVLLMQIFGSLSNIFIEKILNSFEMTAYMSTAATTDYTADAMLLIYSTVLGPFAEELMYRGLLLKPLARYGRSFAILVSAVAFGLMHGDIYQLAFAAAMGILLGYVALEYSIWHSLALHIFNNAVLGVVLPYLTELTGSLFLYMLFYIAGTVMTLMGIVLILKRHRDIAAYFRANMCGRGTLACLVNVWFILFAAWELYEVYLSIMPLTY